MTPAIHQSVITAENKNPNMNLTIAENFDLNATACVDRRNSSWAWYPPIMLMPKKETAKDFFKMLVMNFISSLY